MHSINLLPWRKWQKQRQLYQLFWTTIGMMFAIIVMLISVHRHLNYQLSQNLTMQQAISNKTEKLAMILSDIDALKQNIMMNEKILLLIKQLKNKQNIPLIILDTLADEIPNNTYLDKISYQNKMLHLSGQAKDSNSISLFVSHLKNLSIFYEINLDEVTTNSNALLSQQFKISMKLTNDISNTYEDKSHHALSA